MQETSIVIWISFVVFILAILAIDLGLFHKKTHSVGFKESILWSLVWVALSLAFNAVIYYWRGADDAMLFLTGYLIEKSLSVDNLFVFLLIFSFFKVENKYQHKILFYGIIGALVMRALFIGVGIALIQKFTWVIYIFGGFLVISGIKMLKPQAEDVDLEKNWIINLTKKIFPTTSNMDGDRFFTKIDGKTFVTPLFITLVFVEISDLIFAVDSIPAIIGITSDPFLVFTSNVFAILGLRSLYFALAGVADIFHYLKYGLSLILVFIGVKMLVSGFFHVPVWFTMAFIFGTLGICVGISLIKKESKN